jgi:hypothetical protein
MAGLLFLWLVMESVCGNLREKRVTLFSNNSPTVGWVQQLATCGSLMLAHLIQALALQLKLNGTCPITPLHIAGKENSMMDIPLHLFGSKPKWLCKTNTDLLTMFNKLFPLPTQDSCTAFQLTYAIGMRVTSILLMTDSNLEEWWRLPKVRNLVGNAGRPTLHLWGWTLTYRTPRLQFKSDSSRALQHKSEPDTMVEANRSKLDQYLAQLWPSARQSPWPQILTQQK